MISFLTFQHSYFDFEFEIFTKSTRRRKVHVSRRLRPRSGGFFIPCRAAFLQILFQLFRLVQLLPGEIQIVAAEVTVGRRLLIDRAAQVEHADDARGT